MSADKYALIFSCGIRWFKVTYAKSTIQLLEAKNGTVYGEFDEQVKGDTRKGVI